VHPGADVDFLRLHPAARAWDEHRYELERPRQSCSYLKLLGGRDFCLTEAQSCRCCVFWGHQVIFAIRLGVRGCWCRWHLLNELNKPGENIVSCGT
jgi:hypothetical protein